MTPDILLKEKVKHGTPEKPVQALHFDIGQDTPDSNGFYVENHWHSFMEFLVIRKGRYQLNLNMETQILEEGTLCILNSGDLHQLKSLSPQSCHDAFLFDPEILAFSYNDQWNLETMLPLTRREMMCTNMIPASHPAYPRLSGLMNALIDYAFQKNIGWYEHCKLCLLEIFLELKESGCLIPTEQRMSSADQRQIQRYKQIVLYIEEHYQEPISLDQLAEIVSCNSQYFCRFFRKISGLTPIQYLIQYRLQQSCNLLTCTEKSISEIALDCGFDNISYYIKKFKETYEKTPKQYRMENR